MNKGYLKLRQRQAYKTFPSNSSYVLTKCLKKIVEQQLKLYIIRKILYFLISMIVVCRNSISPGDICLKFYIPA